MKKLEKETIESSIERLELLAALLRLTAEEEQERYDNWSEKTQESEKGDLLIEKIDNLNSAADSLDDAVSQIEDAIYSEI